MALSNWDILELGDGIFGEYTIDIYKNWVNVRDNSGKLISSITSGELSIYGLSIWAARGLQNSIYVFVKNGYGEERKVFAGIGCYGFDNRTLEFLKTRVGLSDSEIGNPDNWFHGSCNYWNEEYMDGFVDYIENLQSRQKYRVDEDFELSPYVGVKKETVEDFRKWLQGDEMKYYTTDWIDTIDWENISRYNQGDMFFIGKEDSLTKVGEQTENPILLDLVKNMTGE